MEAIARFAVPGFLIVAMGMPVASRAGQTDNPMFTSLANEKWAARDAEHVRVRAELAFLEALLGSERRGVALWLLDSEDMEDCLVEKAEAEAADAELAAVYLDQHPLRVGSQARIAAAEKAVSHFAEAILRGREALAEVLDAERNALRGALVARGAAPDPAVRRTALLRQHAELEVERLQQQAAVIRYREMLAKADTAGLLGALPDRGTFLAQRTSRRLHNPRSGSATRGEAPPSRVQQREAQEQLEAVLMTQLEQAIAAEEARIELDEAVQEALAEALESR